TRQPGPYRVLATATAPDGAAVGQREAGWAAQPAADEFARLEPDREWLESIADRTKGEMVEGDGLQAFGSSLSSRDAPINQALILALLAPAAVFPHRDRLPGRGMGPAPGQRPALSRDCRFLLDPPSFHLPLETRDAFMPVLSLLLTLACASATAEDRPFVAIV